jgi:CRISPR-associated endonuclease/helicase Cas3
MIKFAPKAFGHSKENAPTSDWQRLDAHSANVATLASRFAAPFGAETWAWIAGILHDIGKIDARFQSYLRRENDIIDDPEYDVQTPGNVNHSSAGAALAEELFNSPKLPFGRILSYIIAGHHAGLPDYWTASGSLGALEHRLVEGNENLAAIRTALAEVSPLVDTFKPALPTFVKAPNLHFWIRMVFSSLVDADFLDTEAFMSPERAVNRPVSVDLTTLRDTLDAHLDALSNQSSTVNSIRHEVLSQCRAAASKPCGLFSLSVPTGGGKTLSALSFALRHAVHHDQVRIIYVIPYTSIIEQTSEVLSKIFGSDCILEHHSNVDLTRETLRATLATENWDYPIVVTTSVQFFESLYAARTSKCRRLHNIAHSVVIIDEAQLIPPEKLVPCASALNELTRNYGTTILLSTATQPRIEGLDKATEIIPSSMKLSQRLSRVDVTFPEDLSRCYSWHEISSALIELPQVLCIVNKRRDCYDLFHLMPEGTFHLSTLMCGQHRSNTIRRIKEALRDGQPVRVVSTQLVEAGVDIDFPVVYRALCGLDSIVQSAGRCNREGKLVGKGRVQVFIPESPIPRGLLRKGETTTRGLLWQQPVNIEDTEVISKYFDLFYDKLNTKGEEFLHELTPKSAEVLDINFRSVGGTFRLIDDQARRTVFVSYGDGAQLLDRLKAEGPSRGLLRKLQRYSVSLSEYQFKEMRDNGLLIELYPDFFTHTTPSLYDAVLGLDIFASAPQAEDLIV